MVAVSVQTFLEDMKENNWRDPVHYKLVSVWGKEKKYKAHQCCSARSMLIKREKRVRESERCDPISVLLFFLLSSHRMKVPKGCRF